MTSRAAAAIMTTSLLLAATAGLDAGAKLTLTVTPNVSSAPSTVVVRAMVPKDAANRLLHIAADSGSFYRSSDIQLDGARAPLITEIRMKNLPSGDYTVVAMLRDRLGHETMVRQAVVVLNPHAEP